MHPPPEPDRASEERSESYVFPHAIPEDLEAAFAVAFATPATYSYTSDAGSRTSFVPKDPAVLRHLALAVATFVTKLKDGGEPPQNVIIALKTVMRRLTSRGALEPGAYDQLQAIVVAAALKAYFGHTDSSTMSAVVESVMNPTTIDHGVVEPAMATSGHLVLVVDDEEDARHILSTYLKRHGYEVAVAHDSREVVDIARQLRPKVILLDLIMPHLNGRDLVLRLKSDRQTKDIPVIAVTGVHTINESPELVSEKFADVIIKPVQPVDLVRTVHAKVTAR